MAEAPRPPATEAEMRANVSRTLGTALEVLAHLEGSLVKAGFERGLPSYRAMCEVLLGQRIWSLPRADEPLGSQFREVAARAQAVERLLVPYVEIMQRLGALAPEAVAPPAAAPAPDDPLEMRIVQALRREARPVSLSGLREALGAESRAVRAAMTRLVAQGAVAARRASGRELYTLADATPPARRLRGSARPPDRRA